MKKVVFKSPEEVAIKDVEVPQRKDNEVLVKIKKVGICGSDYHSYKGSNPFVNYPFTPGHEGSGEVVEAGPDSGLTEGAKVVIDPVIPCGDCYACNSGRPNVCENLKVIGATAEGLMQEYVTVSEKNVYKASGILKHEQLIFAEPLSIGSQAIYRADVKEGELVTIIGAGPIGIAALLISKWQKSAKQAIIEPNKDRRKIAKSLGADLVLDPEKEDLSKSLKSTFHQPNSPKVIEAVGMEETIRTALSLASPTAKVVVQGIVGNDVTIPTDKLIEKEIDLLGSRLNTEQFPRVVSLLEENHDDLKDVPMLGFHFSEIEKAFESHESKPDLLKTFLEFN